MLPNPGVEYRGRGLHSCFFKGKWGVAWEASLAQLVGQLVDVARQRRQCPVIGPGSHR